MKNKIISTLISIMVIMSMFTSVILAKNSDGNTAGVTAGKSDVPQIDTPDVTGGMGTAAKIILGYIQWIGYAIAVGMLIYIGIKYVMASAAEKGDLKKGLINYVIGAVLIAAASTIAGWIVNIGTGLK